MTGAVYDCCWFEYGDDYHDYHAVFCKDCKKPEFHIDYEMEFDQNRYKCPHGTCESIFSLDEFFRHYETPCAKNPLSSLILDEEIIHHRERLDSFRQLKNVSNDLDEKIKELQSTDEKIKNEETEKKRIENNLEDLLEKSKNKLVQFHKTKSNALQIDKY